MASTLHHESQQLALMPKAGIEEMLLEGTKGGTGSPVPHDHLDQKGVTSAYLTGRRFDSRPGLNCFVRAVTHCTDACFAVTYFTFLFHNGRGWGDT